MGLISIIIIISTIVITVTVVWSQETERSYWLNLLMSGWLWAKNEPAESVK